MDDFDIIREKLDSYCEQPDDKVWEGLEKRLDAGTLSSVAARRGKRTVWLRVGSYALAAVAACLAVVFAIIRRPSPPVEPFNRDVIAESVPAVRIQTVPTPEKIAEEYSVSFYSSSLPQSSGAIQVHGEGQEKEPEQEQENTSSINKIMLEGDSVRKEDGSGRKPAGYPKEWDYGEEKEKRTEPLLSVLSVNSNLGAGLGSNSFSYDGGAMFVSPSDGPSSASASLTQIGAGSYSMPLTFGAQVQMSLGRVALGTGLTYTYLHSEYPAMVNLEKFTVRNNVSYLGLPVILYYNFIKQPSLNVYGNFGG
ncbi:MAG: hypothetical protein LKK19_01060, partial [Bacteroidales bacterium]|nr:hypothetical protein [Bacteroidales bacterium]